MLSVPDTHLDSTHHRGHNSTRSSADVQLVTENCTYTKLRIINRS